MVPWSFKILKAGICVTLSSTLVSTKSFGFGDFNLHSIPRKVVSLVLPDM